MEDGMPTLAPRDDTRFGPVEKAIAASQPAPEKVPDMTKSIPPDFLAAAMKLQSKLHELAQQGETVTTQDVEEYLRKMTGGKYGYAAYKSLQATTPDNEARSVMYGISANQLDNLLGLFSKQAGNESRVRQEAYTEAHPVRSTVGGLLGAVITGKGLDGLYAGLAGEPETVLQAAKAGAAIGGTYSAVDEAGRADDEGILGKLKAGAKGGVLGAITGGVVGAAAGGVAHVLQPKVTGAAKVAAAITKEGGVEQLQERLKEMVDAGRGAEVTLADLGPHLAKALDFAANESENVYVPVEKLLKARTADRAARLLMDVRAESGAPARLIGEAPMTTPAEARAGEGDYGLRSRQLEANTQAVGDRAYGALADANPNFDTSTLPLDQPKISRLWQQARVAGNLSGNGALEGMMDKLAAANPGVPRDVLKTAASQIADASGNGTGERPVSLDDLIALRRGLEGQVSTAFKGGNGSLGNALKDIKTSVDDALEAGAPGYRAANAEYRGANDLQRALDSGHEWWLKADKRELARTVQELGSKPGALDEFRKGIASGLIEKLQGTATNRDAARELLQKSADLDAKLKIIFGDTRTFQSFMARVKAERQMGELAQTIGGSATSRRVAARGIDPAELGIDLAMHGPSALTRAGGAVSRAVTRRATADAMGPMLLTQGAPNIDAFLRTFGAARPALTGSGVVGMPTAGLMSLLPSLFDHGQ